MSSSSAPELAEQIVYGKWRLFSRKSVTCKSFFSSIMWQSSKRHCIDGSGKIQGDGRKFLDRFKSYFGSQIPSQSSNEVHIYRLQPKCATKGDFFHHIFLFLIVSSRRHGSKCLKGVMTWTDNVKDLDFLVVIRYTDFKELCCEEHSSKRWARPFRHLVPSSWSPSVSWSSYAAPPAWIDKACSTCRELFDSVGTRSH